MPFPSIVAVRAAIDNQLTVGPDVIPVTVADGQFAVVQIAVAGILVIIPVLVIRVNLRRCLAVKFYFDAVGLGTGDVDSAPLHPEVLLTMQAVFHGTSDVQRQVLQLHILLTADGVGSIAGHIQSAFAF